MKSEARAAHRRLRCNPGRCRAVALAAAVLLVATPYAFAQMDLSGEWLQKIHEDEPVRDVPQIGDYEGLPINDAARQRADTWEASRWDPPEHECEPHPADYAPRGPGSMRVWADMDPHSMQVTAWHTEIMEYAPTRQIYMDGRAHPPAISEHTWEGFSTGHWHADMLEVDTDLLKEGWPRRNGVPRSNKAYLKEFFIRHSDYLKLVAIVHDPVFFSVPYVVSSEWVFEPGYHPIPSSCTPAQEVIHNRGWVGFNLPGLNVTEEFARRYGIPLEAARGGADTIRPEYQQRLEHLPVPPPLPTEQAELAFAQKAASAFGAVAAAFGAPAAAPEPASSDWQIQPSPSLPNARAGALIDLTGYWMAIVDQDWRFRMMTAAPGETEGIPLNAAGMQLARAWSWQNDQAAGNACKPYGAAGLMRLPERLHIHWAEPDTLQVDTDAGRQTRLLHFVPGTAPAPSLQGYSVARWFKQPQSAGFAPPRGGPKPGAGGSLIVLTTAMSPAYLRSNGVPYSAQAKLLEYFDRIEDQSTSYLTLTQVVSDPTYLREQYLTSYEYLREADAAHWNPRPCGLPAPTRQAVPQLPGL